jgi:16S rRNA (guanine966-N2)-methyltransferase
MRIIAGKFRSRQLKPIGKLKLRPTSDMLRETLFNILGPGVQNARFLELFAGSGAVGIEALSRGAAWVALVERHSAAIRLIRGNLALLQITEGVGVFHQEALAGIARLDAEAGAPFDFVFLDPPYTQAEDYLSTLRALEKSCLLGESSVLIAEHSKFLALPPAIGRLQQSRTVRQGDAGLTFYRIGPSALPPGPA